LSWDPPELTNRPKRIDRPILWLLRQSESVRSPRRIAGTRLKRVVWRSPRVVIPDNRPTWHRRCLKRCRWVADERSAVEGSAGNAIPSANARLGPRVARIFTLICPTDQTTMPSELRIESKTLRVYRSHQYHPLRGSREQTSDVLPARILSRTAARTSVFRWCFWGHGRHRQ